MTVRVFQDLVSVETAEWSRECAADEWGNAEEIVNIFRCGGGEDYDGGGTKAGII